MPNPTTLVATHRDDMAEVLDNQTQSKIVQRAINNGFDHDVAIMAEVDSFRGLLQMPAAIADQQMQGQLKGLAQLPQQLEALSLFLDFQDGLDLNVVVDTNDAQATKTIKQSFDLGYAMAAVFINGQLPQLAKKDLGEELGGEVSKLVQEVYIGAKGTADERKFQLNIHVPQSATEVAKKIAAVAKEKAKDATKRNDLKQIGIACHNYHDTFKMFPFPAGTSELPAERKGKLSWRVHLLPFIDQAPLYEQFKLDEPWDSPHNKALLDKMPDVYKLSDDAKPGYTQYVAPAGKGFVIDGDKSRSFRDVTDGASNSIIVLTVKPDKAEPWTKPGGFDLDPAKAGEILGGVDGGFLALFADGRVLTLDPQLDAKDLKALLTIGGNEVIDRAKLFGEEVRRFDPAAPRELDR